MGLSVPLGTSTLQPLTHITMISFIALVVLLACAATGTQTWA